MKHLVQLLKTSTFHLRHDQVDEDDSYDRYSAIDHSNLGAEVRRCTLDERIDVGNQDARQEATDRSKGYGSFSKLACTDFGYVNVSSAR